ncbi:MAG: integration host factor subunit beta [Proteobacteria bacterium]|nr:integration host factor subunit beta [Pseudomonadota bacterium]
MNRAQIIAKFAERNDLSNAASARFVVAFFEEVCSALKQGEHVEFRGFGSFHPKSYKPYVGRNPKTGESVRVPVRHRVRYRMSEQLFVQLNEHIMLLSKQQSNQQSNSIDLDEFEDSTEDEM